MLLFRENLAQFISVFFAITIMWQGVSSGRKMIDSFISDRQPLTVYHVKVVAKSYKMGCDLRTTLLFMKFTHSSASPSQFFCYMVECEWWKKNG